LNSNTADEAVYAINKFSDWTQEEFNKLLGLKDLPIGEQMLATEESPMPTQSHKDWRDTGNVNGIKDQGSCGSCWAFAANAVHESAWKISRGSLPNLSEQELVDCSRGYSNQGCNGGWYHWAWNYVKAVGGLSSTSQYPYTAKDQSCKSGLTRTCPISSYTQISGNQNNFITHNANRPFAVATDASNWSSYSSGTFTNCGSSINHAVTVVGTTASYIIIRNSWGTRWGQSGHMQLGWGACGVYGYAYILTV